MKTAILSLIIAMLVAVLSVFQFGKYQNFIANTESFIAKNNQKIDNRFTALEQKMDAQDSMLQEDISSLQTAGACSVKSSTEQATPESSVAQDTNKTQALTPEGTKDEWFMNVAYHLVYLANIRLQMDQDVPGAMIYLQEADQALQSVQKIKVGNIQKELRQDLELLNELPELNIQQLWETLGALITTVDTLPIQGMQKISTEIPQTQNTTPQATSATTETKDKTSWRNALDTTWQNMKNLVKIQRHTKPIEPLLSVEEQKLAAENLRLLLEQARWAVLHRNQIIYQQSLLDAKQALTNYFETKDALVQKFESAVDILAKINLHRETVDLKPLLKLFPKSGDH